MKTLLKINASFNLNNSFSRQAATYFEKRWQEKYENTKVIHRDLGRSYLPHLTNEGYVSFSSPELNNASLELSDKLIAEINAADKILISSPVYNFAVPSPLKAYIDHIVRIGRTFEYELKTGLRNGLIRDKSATIIVARGGVPVNGMTPDGVDLYLKGIMNFIGIRQVTIFNINGTTYPGAQESLKKSKEEIDQHFKHEHIEKGV